MKKLLNYMAMDMGSTLLANVLQTSAYANIKSA